LAAANSVNGLIENVSVVAGPAIGAALLAAGPPQVAFYLNAASFLLSAAAVSRVRTRSRPSDVTEGGTAGVLRQVAVGFRAIASSTTGFVLVLFSVMASFFYGTDTVLFAVVARDKLTGETNAYGYLLAALGVGGVLGSFLVPRLSQSRRLGLVITLGMVLYTAPTTALIGVHSTTAACLLEVLRGIGTIVVDVLAITALQRLMPPDLIARVFGVFMSLVLVAISIGALVTAPLVNGAGLDATLLIFGVGASAAVLLLYPLTSRVDAASARRLRELEPRIAALEMVGIFSAASRTVLERLAASATEETVPAGTRIIREGDPADAFYVLANGEVRVSARGAAGGETELRTMGPGEGFGEIGLLQRVPRTASVDAVTDARLYRIDGESFLDALTQEPASAAFMEGARTRMALTHPSYRWTEPAEEPAAV
jgi:Cyclic nucleotide-binding domain/Transmembrane secretion effector